MSSPCLCYRCSRSSWKASYCELYLTLCQSVVGPLPRYTSRLHHSLYHPHKVSSYSGSQLMACLIDRGRFFELLIGWSYFTSYVFHPRMIWHYSVISMKRLAYFTYQFWCLSELWTHDSNIFRLQTLWI